MTTTFLQVTLIICLIRLHGLTQSLPIVEATAGDGQNVNWPEIEKKENAEKDGPGFFYRDCSQGVQAISASSTLAGQGGKNYAVSNLADNDPMTAWVEGKAGYGIGESFTVNALNVNSIFNGYQATPTTWKNNSRVKKFKVYANGKAICLLILKDEMGEQLFELPYSAESGENTVFKFEIMEVYQGLKWDDVAISHVDFTGCCFLNETAIERYNDAAMPVGSLSQPANILCVNPETGMTYPAQSFRVVEQIHLRMLTITTDNHYVTLTPDHPLLIKGHGFISLERLKFKLHMDHIEQLANAGELVEVMVWDKGEIHFEKITAIQSIKGKFKTYTVKDLPVHSAYVADGFITTGY